MITCAKPARISSVMCVASSKRPSWVQRVATKRTQTIKDNLSRLALIGLADAKDVSDIIKDLDAMHKKAFSDLSEIVKQEHQKAKEDLKNTSAVEPDSIFEPETK